MLPWPGMSPDGIGISPWPGMAAGHRRLRAAPLGEPSLHLLDLGALCRLDLIGQLGDSRIDPCFASSIALISIAYW